MTVGRLQPFGNCPQSDDCHEDSGPTINKAIIITRHVGRRHPTTNQSNIKMLELMMMVIIVPVIIIIIIIIIIGMSIPNTQSRPQNAGAHHSTGGKGGTTPTRPTPGPHHTTGRGEATHHHTTPRGGGGVGRNHWGGGGGGGGGGRPNRDHIYACMRAHTHTPDIRIRMRVYEDIYIYTRMYAYVHNQLLDCLSVYTRDVHVALYTYIYIHMNINMYILYILYIVYILYILYTLYIIHINILCLLCMYVCVYIYIYTRRHTYNCEYIYINIVYICNACVHLCADAGNQFVCHVHV